MKHLSTAQIKSLLTGSVRDLGSRQDDLNHLTSCALCKRNKSAMEKKEQSNDYSRLSTDPPEGSPG